MKDVLISVDGFKRALLEIVYCPLSKAHVNEIKTHITVYNKFDTKAFIFAILEDQDRLDSILPCASKTWKEIKDLQFFIMGG